MILILGGAFAGKLTWAVREYGLRQTDLCDLRRGFVPGKRCYYHLEDAEPCPAFPRDAIVIGREIGCGVVPMDAALRLRRETYGRTLQALARQSERVFRIFCGIGEALK